jgi:NAD dependent epimerase/dehydratase family enzyme
MLGNALHRPSFVPAPAFAIRLLLGEMAESAVLNGQRVLPAKAQALGYTFRYPSLENALAELFRQGSGSRDRGADAN